MQVQIPGLLFATRGPPGAVVLLTIFIPKMGITKVPTSEECGINNLWEGLLLRGPMFSSNIKRQETQPRN